MNELIKDTDIWHLFHRLAAEGVRITQTRKHYHDKGVSITARQALFTINARR